MLKENPLIRLNAVHTVVKQAAHRDVGSIRAVVVYARVALGVHADAEIRRPRSRDKYAEVRCHQNIGVLPGRIIRFQRAAVQRHHQRRRVLLLHAAIAG